MSRLKILLCALLFSVAGTVQAGSFAVFEDSFEGGTSITPLFPRVDGEFQLPPSASATQLAWFMGKLAAGAVTTQAEVNAHFSATWLAGINAASTVSFIHSVRNTYPDAYIADLVTVTPTRIVATLRSPLNNNIAYFQFGARFADTQRINFVSVSAYNHNTVQFVADQSLTLTQAADKFMTLSSQAGLLVARIDSNGVCQPILSRNPTTLRSIASVFKTWVLGGVATAVRDGVIGMNTGIALTAADRAPPVTEGIALEANGTSVSVLDMARFMMGVSDNTATDHLHERIGRARIDAWVAASGVADVTVLQPVLKLNEQFHVFRTLTRTQADNYVGGTEAYQISVLPMLESLGTTFGSFFHVDLLVDGSWRASPMDVCQNFAKLRTFNGPALQLVDAALGASVAQPNVRERWDRVWYKGGSLAQATNQFNVFTHAWMLERNNEQPLVLIALSNSPTGGIGGTNNPNGTDLFDIQSVTGRMLELMSQM